MGMRDLVMGRPACAAPGQSSSSSSNPLSSLFDALIGYSPKSELKKELSTSEASLDLFKAVPLSTLPGDEDEFKLDQGSIRSMPNPAPKIELSATAVLRKALAQGSIKSMKGTDFLNGHHGDACGENFQTSVLSVPELSGIEPHFQKSQKIESATSLPEMDVPHNFLQSPFPKYEDWADQSKEDLHGLQDNRSMDYIDDSYDDEMRFPRKIPYPQMDEFWNRRAKTIYELHNSSTEVSEFEQTRLANGQIGGTDITNMVVLAQSLEQTSGRDNHTKLQGIDEFSGVWLLFLGIVLSHLGGLSPPRFRDEPIKWHEEVIGHRIWIEMDGLQQRSGWSVKVEATRKTLSDALQDAAMLVVITLRQHFPVEFRCTPFTVLPMVPGQRSELDYPSTGGGAEAAATFMGISYDDVMSLQQESFESYQHEHWESCEAWRVHLLWKQRSLAVARKMVEELPDTQETIQRIAEILKTGEVKVPRDCGWSVLVSNKEQQQQQAEPSHQEEKPPATEESYPVIISIRARL